MKAHFKLLRSTLVVSLATLALVLFAASQASAIALTVNVTDDADDGTCDSTHCSLREAINAANTNPGPDVIEFNTPSCGRLCTIQPQSELPSLSAGGTTIDGYTQPGAAQAEDGNPAQLQIEIDGSNAGDGVHGFTIQSADNVIKGLVINRFSGRGIYVSSGATGNNVSGNYIGTDADGRLARGNGGGGDFDGVFVGTGAQNNTVGGNTPGERNVISGNARDGVRIYQSDGNIVSGNYIGTNARGTAPLGNGSDGVYLSTDAQNNTIGGDTAGERNVISGNAGGGVQMFDNENNVVSGNYIGTDARGTAPLGNGNDGVFIGSGTRNNTIGGNTAGERNVISGNADDGVHIFDGDENIVTGNYVGTDAGGTVPLGNGSDGVKISDDARYNTIGPDNVIAYNRSDGVLVDGPSTIGNTITRNSIFSNQDGIDLTGGANGAIAPPEILTAILGPVNITGTACAGCTVEVFGSDDSDGEGHTYLGETSADASGDFGASVKSLSSRYLTATATHAVSGTSEFSDVSISNIAITYLPYFVQGYCTDNYEPNDACGQAYGPLTSGHTYQSWISGCDLTTPKESDYFYIDVVTTNRINIDLTGIPAGTDYDLFLYREPDLTKSVDESRGLGSSEKISYTPPAAGRFCIRVYGFFGSSTDPYALRVTYD